MYTDDELLPLSALQHYVFCPRQCALIHIEQQWEENRLTAEGRALHDRADRPEQEFRDGIRREYAVPIRSLELGLVGKADLVEYHPASPPEGTGKIVPVEYKRGRPKPDHCDWVQVCAQALCLEEMLGIHIETGAVFYGLPRRRQLVPLTPALREETRTVARALHALVRAGRTPPPRYHQKKCASCSLYEICMPRGHPSVAAYLRHAIENTTNSPPPP